MSKSTSTSASTNTITIKLVKGLAAKRKIHVAVVKSLGLSRVGDVTVQPDNEATRGKVKKVSHLVAVI